MIDKADTQSDLDEKERFWINFFKSNDKNKGYNLDSGGHSGGKKSEETKYKIGLTTKQKWNDPEIAAKMRIGLQKGADAMKMKKKRYEFVCPICKRIMYVPYHELKKRKFCSLRCAGQSEWNQMQLKLATQNSMKQKALEKSIIKQDIIQWILTNKELVLTCPYNKITSTLRDLLSITEKKYNIKDIRSLFACFEGVTSRRTFLDKLKEIIISKENVC